MIVMLLANVGSTASLPELANRLHTVGVKAENGGVCPLSPDFWMELGEIYQQLYYHMMNVEANVKKGNPSVLFNVQKELKLVENETKALESTVKDLCSPFLLTGSELYAECSCPEGTCSGAFCMCTSNGSCWAIFGNDSQSGSNESGELNRSLEWNLEAAFQTGRYEVYNVEGHLLYSDGSLPHDLATGIYFVRYPSGEVKRLLVR
ncbi:MAG: hypothetical protein GXO39_06750 [Thermotogae bacterium]|nr:hypothetical protein [Thermotogota bacterium]